MAQQVCVVLNAAEREQLAAIAADRNRPRKHIERARIVLASADRHSAQRVAQSIGVSRPTGFVTATSVGSEGGKARPELTPLQRRSAIALPLRL
jgi:hypothetical protein